MIYVTLYTFIVLIGTLGRNLDHLPLGYPAPMAIIDAGCRPVANAPGTKALSCARLESQGRYRLIVVPGIADDWPASNKRSRLQRSQATKKIRRVGPKFLPDPEDALDLRLPTRW